MAIRGAGWTRHETHGSCIERESEPSSMSTTAMTPAPATKMPSRVTWLHRLYPHARLSPCTLARVAGTIPVGLVTAIIVMAYLTAVPATLVPLLSVYPLRAIFLLFVFHFIFISTVVNYALLVLLDPGAVPPSWSAPQPARDRSYDGNRRYCRICRLYKPDRAHHCSVCGRCVQKMDHHCVFINNCVGFLNHKFFIAFITYAFLGCSMVTIVSLPTFIDLIATRPRARAPINNFSAAAALSPNWKTVSLIGFIIVSAFTFALAVFVVLHYWLVSKGRTTIEMYEVTDPIRAPQVAEYDLGIRRNIRTVCGSVPLCWFLPTRAYVEGDGLTYPRKGDDVGLNV